MKNLIAITAIALSTATAGFASQVNDAQAFFAANNNSAAERNVSVRASEPSNDLSSIADVVEKLTQGNSTDGQPFFGSNPPSNTAGKEQLARSLGLDPADYTISELVTIKSMRDDSSDS